MKVEVTLDLEELWDSMHYNDDKEDFIKKHINQMSNNDIIETIGGIDAVIEYLKEKDFSTTDKVRFRHFLATINEIKQETII